jgi:hypothetical protein
VLLRLVARRTLTTVVHRDGAKLVNGLRSFAVRQNGRCCPRKGGSAYYVQPAAQDAGEFCLGGRSRMYDEKNVEPIARAILELANRSLNTSVSFFDLQRKIPDINVEDINDVLTAMRDKGMINVTNSQSYRGVTLMKDFSITTSLIDKYK